MFEMLDKRKVIIAALIAAAVVVCIVCLVYTGLFLAPSDNTDDASSGQTSSANGSQHASGSDTTGGSPSGDSMSVYGTEITDFRNIDNYAELGKDAMDLIKQEASLYLLGLEYADTETVLCLDDLAVTGKIGYCFHIQTKSDSKTYLGLYNVSENEVTFEEDFSFGEENDLAALGGLTTDEYSNRRVILTDIQSLSTVMSSSAAATLNTEFAAWCSTQALHPGVAVPIGDVETIATGVYEVGLDAATDISVGGEQVDVIATFNGAWSFVRK